jgi:asparagine N-glycosylation enzyme membrane subunit Stt3
MLSAGGPAAVARGLLALPAVANLVTGYLLYRLVRSITHPWAAVLAAGL